MNIFFDSSALVKLFINEPGTKTVSRLVNKNSNQIWILDLLEVELQSAIFRKFRNGEIPEEMFDVVQKGIVDQLNEFGRIYMSGDIVEKAAVLITRFGKNSGLRTLDALRLAAWTLHAENDWTFVTSDRPQNEVVIELGGDVMFVE